VIGVHARICIREISCESDCGGEWPWETINGGEKIDSGQEWTATTLDSVIAAGTTVHMGQ